MRERVERHIKEHEYGQVEAPRPSEPSGRQLEQEVDKGVWAPGALGTKSQLLGGLGGTIIGSLVGGLIGLVLGFALFAGEPISVVITIVVGVLAGATALGLAGGFVYNRGKQERGEPDV